MPYNYNKLWKLLIDKGINREQLKDIIKASPSTMARMGKNETISLNVLARICDEFECNIGDILDYVHKKDQ